MVAAQILKFVAIVVVIIVWLIEKSKPFHVLFPTTDESVESPGREARVCSMHSKRGPALLVVPFIVFAEKHGVHQGAQRLMIDRSDDHVQRTITSPLKELFAFFPGNFVRQVGVCPERLRGYYVVPTLGDTR